MSILWIILGLVLLTVGAEVLLRGAVALAQSFGMSTLVIGLTVVAFGTSAPELAVSLNAAHDGRADIAVGNVVGSNTFNVLFILGLAALITPLAASRQLVRLDVPIMIGVCMLTWLMAANGVIGRAEGALLALGIVAYTTGLIVLGKKTDTPHDAQPPDAKPAARPTPRRPVRAAVFIILGLALLVLGARWLVHGATDLARAVGVSELLIGLTIVAAGTSMPEVATSVMASLRGQRDIAIGNVVGSNIFNLLCVLGFTALFAPNGVPVAPQALRFDIPVMCAVALACLPVFFTGGRIARWEGALFLAYYIAYLTFLTLAATQHAALATFTKAMLMFAIPLTVLGITLSLLPKRRASTDPQQ